jgi:hypothetical protein
MAQYESPSVRRTGQAECTRGSRLPHNCMRDRRRFETYARSRLVRAAGDPWSFSVPGDVDRTTCAMLQEFVAKGRTKPQSVIRIGSLTVLPTMFMSCANLVAASRELRQYVERCTSQSRPDAVSCAIAAFRGSRERLDDQFAMAVQAYAMVNDAPNFVIPDDDVASIAVGNVWSEINDLWHALTATAKKRHSLTPHLPQASVKRMIGRSSWDSMAACHWRLFRPKRTSVSNYLRHRNGDSFGVLRCKCGGSGWRLLGGLVGESRHHGAGVR